MPLISSWSAIVIPGGVCGDAVAFVAHDDGDVIGGKPPRREDRVAEERAAAHGMEDFGDLGFHPGSLTGG